MPESNLRMASDSIRNAVWEYTTTIEDVLLLSRIFHAWAGLSYAGRMHLRFHLYTYTPAM